MKQGSSISTVVTILVLLSLWSAQTDSFPLPQEIRPSWYVYGWPFCFATSGHGRFNFSSFDTASLILDIVVSVLLILCTWVAAKHLLANFPKFSIGQFVGMNTGVVFVLLVASGTRALVESFGFPFTSEGVSSMAGNTRRWERFSPITQSMFWIGVFSVGYTMTASVACLLGRRHTAADPEPGNEKTNILGGENLKRRVAEIAEKISQ